MTPNTFLLFKNVQHYQHASYKPSHHIQNPQNSGFCLHHTILQTHFWTLARIIILVSSRHSICTLHFLLPPPAQKKKKNPENEYLISSPPLRQSHEFQPKIDPCYTMNRIPIQLQIQPNQMKTYAGQRWNMPLILGLGRQRQVDLSLWVQD